MKRTYLKRKKSLNKTSPRQKIIIACEKLLREELIQERGAFCQLSGRPANGLGLFHILPKAMYPRIRLHKFNLLLVNWLPYHHWWHHDCYRKDEIEDKIRTLLGDNYLMELKIINAGAPKLSAFQLELIYASLKKTPPTP